jgi:hypothetical protein
MSLDNLLATIDAEISRLQQARELLTGAGTRGAQSPKDPKAKPRPKRVMSAAVRKRIGDAQRQRWAAQRKAGAK